MAPFESKILDEFAKHDPNLIRNKPDLTTELCAPQLATMRETLRSKYSQVVQMSTGFETDMNTPFIF